MTKYAYTTKVGSLKEFLMRIKNKELGIPKKITIRYLVSIGYKSNNDRPIVRILKTIGFTDNKGKPTKLLSDFRGEQSGQIMASALKNTYDELFLVYPEAQNASNKELMNFFAQKQPSLKKGTLQYLVSTFRSLCGFADFESAEYVQSEPAEKEVEEKVVDLVKAQKSSGVTINLNIQLNLPAVEDAKVYDKIFKALKDNILSQD